MRCEILTSLAIAALFAATAGADDPAKPRADDAPQVEPKPADGDAPLPSGFPGATRPGEIEVKSYPAYRSALAKGRGMTVSSGDLLFWPLFRHIEKNEIAMTAPVINTYKDPDLAEKAGARGELTMEFLYREPTLGKTGPDGNLVEVSDHPAGRYVCLGLQGRMTDERMREGVARLRAWLDEHRREWTAAGPPRRLGYHGPMTPAPQQLWEVQLPVEPAEAEDDPGGPR